MCDEYYCCNHFLICFLRWRCAIDYFFVTIILCTWRVKKHFLRWDMYIYIYRMITTFSRYNGEYSEVTTQWIHVHVTCTVQWVGQCLCHLFLDQGLTLPRSSDRFVECSCESVLFHCLKADSLHLIWWRIDYFGSCYLVIRERVGFSCQFLQNLVRKGWNTWL